MIALAEAEGIDAVADAHLPALLSEKHLAREDLTSTFREMARKTGVEAYLRQQTAIMNRPDSRELLREIDVPTLVIVGADDTLTPQQPVAPIDLTPDLSTPLLGIFGNEDASPSPEEVDQHEEALKANGKDYEFHRYDGAGHGFWYHDRAIYRPEQTMDSFAKVLDCFGSNLG